MRLRSIVFVAVALIGSGPTGAALISQSRSWNTGISASPATLVFDPFDTALGTLTEVQVVLGGVMSVQAFAAPFPDGQGNFLPYSFTLLSELDVVTPGGTGFAFGSTARWLAPFTVAGAGQVVVASSPFELTFAFGALSDLLGFALPDGVSGFTQPPVTIDGRRSDFEEDAINALIGIQQMLLVPRLPQVSGAPVAVTPTDLSFGGFLRLDYRYEERLAVPEPAALPLLVVALGALGIAYRGRHTARR